MVTELFKDLETAKQRVAELQTTIAKEQNKKLAKLHLEYGFDDVGNFIRAIKAASSGKKGGAVKGAKGKKGKRAKITDKTKDEVKALVAAGKTGSAIAKELGISLPSVQNIKKELGLVKSRR